MLEFCVFIIFVRMESYTDEKITVYCAGADSVGENTKEYTGISFEQIITVFFIVFVTKPLI